eukprot:3647595-Pyramimonas_sp.AAC.1
MHGLPRPPQWFGCAYGSRACRLQAALHPTPHCLLTAVRRCHDALLRQARHPRALRPLAAFDAEGMVAGPPGHAS